MFSLQVTFSYEFTLAPSYTYNHVHSFVIKEAHNIHACFIHQFAVESNVKKIVLLTMTRNSKSMRCNI